MHCGIHENKQRVGQTENGLGSTGAASNRLLVHYSLSRQFKLSSVHGGWTGSACEGNLASGNQEFPGLNLKDKGR